MKKLIALLLAYSLAGCAQADYEADLKGADPGCCLLRDVLPNGPLVLKQGNGDHGEAPTLSWKDGMLEMALLAPADLPTDAAASVGIFRSGLSFGQGQYFSVNATFQNPQRDKSKDPWTVLIIARTGDVADASNLPRLQISLQVVNGLAKLKVMEGPNAGDTNAIILNPTEQTYAIADLQGFPAINDAIYTGPQEFTLKLSVKPDGTGTALLTSPAFDPLSIDFKTNIFTITGGAPLTTFGAALANVSSDLPASVDVKHFEIWAH